jgi:hypothetical protein
MNTMLKVCLALVALGTCFTMWCLIKTTAISMTLFFSFGIPLYALAILLYLVEFFRDLRSHDVL